jgi:Domain of unknown function (DUF4349)
MRLREREPEPSAEVERELRALDRALADEPVPAEFAGLAELARELRDERPSIEVEFAALLDERAASGFEADTAAEGPATSGSERLGRLVDRFRAMPPRRLLAPAGAAVTLLVVVSVVVSQSGGPDGGEGDAERIQPQTEPALPEGGGAQGAVAEEPPLADVAKDLARGAPGRASYLVDPGAAEAAAELPSPGERELAQRVDMSLSTEPEDLRDVADGVLAVADRHRGFVVNSSVSTGDPGSRGAESGRASFQLKIPARQVQSALAELSELAHVSSRTDGTVDITNRFNSARERIEKATEERDRLLRKLENAVTFNERRAIRRQIDVVEDELRAAEEALADAQQRVKLVPVSVTVTADGEPDDGNWGIGDAINDAGDVLTVAAGIALVTAAVLLPLGLLVALFALIWRATLRQRRERALDAA